jgi:N-acetylglutamate synthase-like GNAT family acetyltransferase
MNPPKYVVRRATVDDLPQLISLWKLERLPWESLEKRFTEFQVVDDRAGHVLGALGLQIVSHQAWLHSEVFLEFDKADEFRELLWQRLQSISHNFSLVRIWTLERSPFWHGNGFHVAGSDECAKLPATFGDAHAEWYVLQLRQEHPQTALNPDKELTLFREMSQVETRQTLEKAKVMRLVATVLASVLLISVVAMLVYLLRKMPPR